ncbi:TonB-dependent siderophore receptor [Larsenimonas salina]|uniref:TonB-dependent siderophore receptor n=1 Tax=Larsenimonas salina TaxID=1295565 RepID=UPI0032EE2D4E
MAYRLVGLGSSRDTQFGPVEEKRYAFAPSLTWDVTDDTSVTFMAYLQKDPEGGYHSGVPYDGAVTSHNGRHIDNTFFDGEEAFDGFERTQRMVGYSLTHYVSDAAIARQKFRYLDSDVDMDQVYGYEWGSPDSTTLQRFYSGARESLQAWTLDNQLEMRFEHADVEHTLLFGLDYQTRANDVVWRSGSFPALDAFNPSYGARPSGDFTVTNRERHELSQTGIYIQDQIAYGGWHATVGGRLDRVEIENKDRLGSNDSTLDETEFSGRAGLLYRFDSGLAPYASYNTAFTPTSFVDESGDLLEPMTGTQWEGGLKFRPPGTSDLYTASLFRITQENVATKEQPSDPYRAVGEIRSQGVELEADVELTPRLSLKAGYSYTDITYSKSDDESEEGHQAVYAPRHQASAWGIYTLSDVDNVNVGLGVRYVGGIEADRANIKRVPDYTLVDAAFGAGLGALGLNDASIRINVANLLDKSYVAACNSLSYCYFGAERSLTATVDYQF